MTDIVERLRDGAGADGWVHPAVAREAADEIERLHEELDRLQRAYDQLREIYMNTVAR